MARRKQQPLVLVMKAGHALKKGDPIGRIEATYDQPATFTMRMVDLDDRKVTWFAYRPDDPDSRPLGIVANDARKGRRVFVEMA